MTTLGRGGSDTTAVALAAALEAEACEIYSDVDGVFSADPRVVPEARKLEELSLRGDAGAGGRRAREVLNAQAVEFAREAGHRHRGPQHPRRQAPARASDRRRSPVRAVASDTEVRVLEVAGRPAGGRAPAARRGVLSACGSSPGRATGQGGSWWSFRSRTCTGVEAFDAGLRALGAEPHPGLGTVTLAGPGVGTDSAVLARCLGAAAGLGIQVRALHGSPLQLTFVVETERVAELARELHRATR